jgi:hypothetical protein
MAEPLIRYETRAGEPIQAAGRRIIPFSKALIVRFPGLPGGVIWNRPVSVSVQEADGQEQVIPIVDVTRLAIWSMLGGSLLAMVILGLLVGRKSRTARTS